MGKSSCDSLATQTANAWLALWQSALGWWDGRRDGPFRETVDGAIQGFPHPDT